jgi:uncharacterized protein involved in exopolysaccharide biosynthesis
MPSKVTFAELLSSSSSSISNQISAYFLQSQLEQREEARKVRSGRLREEMESLQKAVKGYEEVLNDCWKESQLLDKVY